jgi:predicted acylesterase/phospholipase RssA
LTFFKEITILGRTYSDGGLVANNPVSLVHGEASEMFPGRQQVMISLGTGTGAPLKFDPHLSNIATLLADLATQTERTADEFYRRQDGKDAREGRYFRFNVAGLGDIAMDEAAEVHRIEDLTERHLQNPEVSRKAIDCAKELSRGAYEVTKQLPEVERLPDLELKLPTGPGQDGRDGNEVNDPLIARLQKLRN